MKRSVVVLCSLLAALALVACADGADGGSAGGVNEQCRIDADRDGHFAIRPGCVGNTDCADNDAKIPGPIEIPDNGKDDDCVGGDKITPSDCTRTVDKDGDGYYDVALKGTAQQPNSCKGEDCDDKDRNVNPSRTEIANNGKDDDCNPNTPDEVPDCDDQDEDGWGIEGKNECPNRTADDKTKFDCNDNDPDVNPGAAEICDGKDNDCDDTGDGKGVDECLDPEGKVVDNIKCGAQRAICLGRLKAKCTENRDCDVEAGYACHTNKLCLLFGESAEDRCFDNSDCVTGTCDLGSGKCSEFCEATICGTQNVCGDSEELLCSNERGCHHCVNSDDDGKCGCGLCAGYRCFDGEYFAVFREDDAPEAGGVSTFLQVLNELIDCFAANKEGSGGLFCPGNGNTELCKSLTMIPDTTVSYDDIRSFVCEGDHAGLDGNRFELANDMVGCGIDCDNLKMDRPVGRAAAFSLCSWWDDEHVVVGLCEDYPARL